MAGIGQWRPAQGAHAIQMAAVGINFREGITGHVLNGLGDKISTLALDLGLGERSPLQEMQFAATPNGPQPIFQPAGCEFLRRERPDFFSDKLSLGKASIRYEDWSYTRWNVLAEKLETLISPVIEAYEAATLVADIFVEYIDIFTAPTASDDSVFLVVREDSPFVASGAASANRFWHSHSGFFEDSQPQRLHQVNIDVSEAPSDEGVQRIVQIRTFVSDRANRPSEAPSDVLTENWPSIAARLKDLHDSAKGDFRAILTTAAADAVSLG